MSARRPTPTVEHSTSAVTPSALIRSISGAISATTSAARPRRSPAGPGCAGRRRRARAAGSCRARRRVFGPSVVISSAIALLPSGLALRRACSILRRNARANRGTSSIGQPWQGGVPWSGRAGAPGAPPLMSERRVSLIGGAADGDRADLDGALHPGDDRGGPRLRQHRGAGQADADPLLRRLRLRAAGGGAALRRARPAAGHLRLHGDLLRGEPRLR